MSLNHVNMLLTEMRMEAEEIAGITGGYDESRPGKPVFSKATPGTALDLRDMSSDDAASALRRVFGGPGSQFGEE